MTIVENTRLVTGGVDTHKDTHTAAVVDQYGGKIAIETFRADPDGYRELVGWMASFGTVERVGVEGTGSYGAGLSRFLRSEDLEVIEIDRPNRQARHRNGKSDPVDALAAARAVTAGDATGHAKASDGPVEAMRIILVAKRSTRSQRIQTINQIRHLVITAPESTRGRLRDLSTIMVIKTAAAMRPRPTGDIAADTCVRTIVELARRARDLTEYNKTLDRQLTSLIGQVAPGLLERPGIGPDSAALLLAAAGDNPERLTSEGAWAHLCGVAPIEASSGQTKRHKLNKGGNRQANLALYRIALVRMAHDARTRGYVERLTAEGKNKREIIRCLKRYIAREVYKQLPRNLA